MPFDGTDFQPKRPPPQRPALTDKAMSRFFLFLALSLSLTPISMAAVVDLVRYCWGH